MIAVTGVHVTSRSQIEPSVNVFFAVVVEPDLRSLTPPLFAVVEYWYVPGTSYYINTIMRLILIGELFSPFFPFFPKCGNNRRYVSIYGGVLSLFVKFSRSKKIKFVQFHIYIWKTNQGNMEEILKNWVRGKCGNYGKSSPIRMTLSHDSFGLVRLFYVPVLVVWRVDFFVFVPSTLAPILTILLGVYWFSLSHSL